MKVRVFSAVKHLYIFFLKVRLKHSTTDALSAEVTVKKSMLFQVGISETHD